MTSIQEIADHLKADEESAIRASLQKQLEDEELLVSTPKAKLILANTIARSLNLVGVFFLGSVLMFGMALVTANPEAMQFTAAAAVTLFIPRYVALFFFKNSKLGKIRQAFKNSIPL